MTAKAPPVGLGTSAETSGKSGPPESMGATVGGNCPDLARVIDAWPTLTDDQKGQILAVVNQEVTP